MTDNLEEQITEFVEKAADDVLYWKARAEKAERELAEAREQRSIAASNCVALRHNADELAAQVREEEEKSAAAITRAEAATLSLTQMRKALEPFATFAETFVERDTEGAGWRWVTTGNDRISDWFGPSDFGLAAHFASPPKTGEPG